MSLAVSRKLFSFESHQHVFLLAFFLFCSFILFLKNSEIHYHWNETLFIITPLDCPCIKNAHLITVSFIQNFTILAVSSGRLIFPLILLHCNLCWFLMLHLPINTHTCIYYAFLNLLLIPYIPIFLLLSVSSSSNEFFCYIKSWFLKRLLWKIWFMTSTKNCLMYQFLNFLFLFTLNYYLMNLQLIEVWSKLDGLILDD